MSHFVVIVFGDNPKEALEPYWELDLSEEELKNDPRASFIDCTEEVMKDAKECEKDIKTKYNGDIREWARNFST